MHRQEVVAIPVYLPSGFLPEFIVGGLDGDPPAVTLAGERVDRVADAVDTRYAPAGCDLAQHVDQEMLGTQAVEDPGGGLGVFLAGLCMAALHSTHGDLPTSGATAHDERQGGDPRMLLE